MRVIRYLIVIFCFSLIGLEITASNTTFAQGGTPQAAQSCAILAPDILKAAKSACDTAKPNSVCLGNVNVQRQFVGPSEAAFAKQGDQFDLANAASEGPTNCGCTLPLPRQTLLGLAVSQADLAAFKISGARIAHDWAASGVPPWAKV